MVRLYIAFGVAIVAIVGLSAWEAVYSDRFVDSSVTAEEFGQRFANVPMVVGPWVGTDMRAETATLEMAGAVNHVSRRYVNQNDPSQSVDLWLVVGHSREICRHTPDICYPSQGFSPVGFRGKERIENPDDPEHPATFFTGKFRNESPLNNRLVRVFWAWNGNQPGKDQWEAPEAESIWSWVPFKSTGPKMYYGNNTALYKMYFTASIADSDEEAKDNPAMAFAKLMLPEVNRALFPERYKDKPRPEPAATAPADDAAAPAVAEPGALESPLVEPSALDMPADAALPSADGIDAAAAPK